jgi:RNA polymerase sigma-70 factor, ECF subfamily
MAQMAVPQARSRSALSEESESALLARLRQGDDAAYEELVRTLGGPLLAAARRLLKREEDAQDALQEAFLSAFKALPTFEAQSRLSTWLHRITINACLMKLRARKRRPGEHAAASIEDLLPTFLPDGHQTRPNTPWAETSDVAAHRKEVQDLVRSSIDRLPDDFRTVLILRDIEEVDTNEAAEMLHLTPAAVKTRLHRARQALRQLLDPYFAKGAL